MRGIVFTEFLDMVEDKFSSEIVDDIIDMAGVDGAYTSVGKYEACELARLVHSLAEKSGAPVPDLLRTFGHHIFGVFLDGYPQMFAGIDDALPLLEQVHGHIHVEVRKLYPDAELPVFRTSRAADGAFHLQYESERPLADFAHGLVEACVEHFGNSYHIARNDPGTSGKRADFVLTAR